MSNLLKHRFKLYNIQFNLKKLSDGREIIAFLRYAWYVDEYSPKQRIMINEINELVTDAVKRIDPVAMESIKDIEYDTNLICLRNSFRLPFANVDVVPSFNDSTDGAELFVGRGIPTFRFQIYSAGNLFDASGYPDFDLSGLSFPMNYDEAEWQYYTELADYYRQHMKTVPDMMEIAMPGLLYPLQIGEVEVGDYFFTSYNTVAKVMSTKGNVIKMSDGNHLQVYDLRPIHFTYLDTDAINDEDVIRAIFNFPNGNPKYAHILQNMVRRINAGIHIQLCDATLASDGINYFNIYN